VIQTRRILGVGGERPWFMIRPKMRSTISGGVPLGSFLWSRFHTGSGSDRGDGFPSNGTWHFYGERQSLHLGGWVAFWEMCSTSL